MKDKDWCSTRLQRAMGLPITGKHQWSWSGAGPEWAACKACSKQRLRSEIEDLT